jgi:hypothetical protein
MLSFKNVALRLTAAVPAVFVFAIPVWLGAQQGMGGGMGSEGPSGQHAAKERELAQSVHRTLELAQSVHRTLGCAECHGEAEMVGGMGEGMGDGGETGKGCPDPVNTCARCHGQAMAAYSPSVHSAAFRRDTLLAATCVACHGSHSVKAVADPQSPVSRLRVSQDTCARCHAPASVMAMHGPQPNVVPDYRESVHGLSVALGDQRVATCVSCHSNHEIRPSRDPFSTVSAAKMYQTCAACHAGTVPTFATGGVHHNPALSGHKVVDIAGFMYLMTIVVVISSMLLHNGPPHPRTA